VFLRSVGQVKTEKYAGICQPLGAREQGFFHGGGFGQLGAVRAFAVGFLCYYLRALYILILHNRTLRILIYHYTAYVYIHVSGLDLDSTPLCSSLP
jgi:hypothetical protein